jgi:CheY-like chemotaxis protein
MPLQSEKRVVLVVEDDQDIRDVLGEFLEINGYRVALAANGAEALRYLKRRREGAAPCLILLDLMMPTMDGREFLARRAGFPELTQIPVVVVTAASDPRAQLADLSATSVLRKPFDLDVLLARVNFLSAGASPALA